MKRTPLFDSPAPEYLGKIPGDLLFFDMETLPTEDPQVIQMLADKVLPPGNMKKEDTISAWERDEKPGLVLDAVSKTSFDGAYGRVCCVSWAFGDKPVEGLIGEEVDVLKGFLDAVRDHNLDTLFNTRAGTYSRYTPDDAKPHPLQLRVGGHNIRDFDMRFLWKRVIINKLSVPQSLPWREGKWSERFQDTMSLWDPEKRISLGNLCRALGIDHEEDDFDGSMVATAFKQGRHSKILRYCKADTEAARRCWYRMMIAPLF